MTQFPHFIHLNFPLEAPLARCFFFCSAEGKQSVELTYKRLAMLEPGFAHIRRQSARPSVTTGMTLSKIELHGIAMYAVPEQLQQSRTPGVEGRCRLLGSAARPEIAAQALPELRAPPLLPARDLSALPFD
nr:hypothetical protein [Cupriavidus sp. TA19]